ncbi:MAG: thiamine phosphate synthase, partial [Gluconacetobacter diazotrophicus]|nr:thiamine phosphate synthase [Gluconacetobacter diazotrophicus]
MALPGRFYPVVDSAERVALVAEAGARLVQLRVKDLADAVLEAELRAAADA